MFNMMNIDINNEIFRSLGLNSDEINTYTYLNKAGVQSIKQISTETNINRTTTYRVVESLIEKGLAEWVIGKRGKKVQASPPENITVLLNNRRDKLADIENKLPNLISGLKLQKPVAKFETSVKYYEGVEGAQQMTWNRLKAKGFMRSYTPFGLNEIFGIKHGEAYSKEWVKKKLVDHIITNGTRMEYIKNLAPKYQGLLKIKVIPAEKFYMTNDISIYNDTVSIISLERKNIVGVEIENPEIARTQKSIFDIVWEVATPIEKFKKRSK